MHEECDWKHTIEASEDEKNVDDRFARLHSIERMKRQCSSLTGNTDKRLPRRSSANPASSASACAFISASVIGRFNFLSSFTSTMYQRGASGLLSGSECGSRGSNAV